MQTKDQIIDKVISILSHHGPYSHPGCPFCAMRELFNRENTMPQELIDQLPDDMKQLLEDDEAITVNPNSNPEAFIDLANEMHNLMSKERNEPLPQVIFYLESLKQNQSPTPTNVKVN